jgi:ribosome-binding factor A
MPSHRALRVAEAIREVVSSAILFEVSDPRVSGITVLRSEVTSDLRNATVFVSVMGTESEQKLAMNGLQSASGFLQAKVAARLQTRTTPHLIFKRDVGIKKSIEMSKIIDEALAADRPPQPNEADGSAGDPRGATSNED